MTSVADTNTTQATAAESRYLAEARRRVLVYDGAMGTQILDLGLTAADFGGAQYEGCPEILAITRPDAIRDIHRAYLAAGADVVETDTFTGTRLKLDDYGLGERTHEINAAAARLAREAALRRRLDGPYRHAALLRRPIAERHHLPTARRAVSRAGGGADRRRR